mmetsp:Transcript_5799/g.8115  ORF Transcript_5799/g.8115 Transcript_5799/m.8115 type:complete len:385 (-) Transcript_5799:61-1215(-)
MENSFQKRLRLSENKEFVTRLGPRFRLETQPNEEQRKAYANENRYITPNPLVVSEVVPAPNAPAIRDCRVSVRLLYVNGEELEQSKTNILTGQLTQTMFGSENERKAKFALKVTDTSNRTKFKLCFTVTYTCEGREMSEVLYSTPFRVIANRGPRKKTNTPVPRLIASIPQEAPLGGAEVWIRGNGFVDRETTIVSFGDQVATIIDIEENLIVCKAPSRASAADVHIMVTNVSAETEEQTVSALPLPFRYSSGLDGVLQSSSFSVGPIAPASWNIKDTKESISSCSSSTVCNAGCGPDFPVLPEEPFGLPSLPTMPTKLPGFTFESENFGFSAPNYYPDMHAQEPLVNLEPEDPFAEYPDWGNPFQAFSHPPHPTDLLYQFLRK